ncbi:hypothetical protein [Pseudomonas aeruginosa]|uniref:hypothetical protein n=5 Tax=Pseudomonas aeruginosa TaxID=287 RepID=UPI0034A03F58|nr:hypothetical protein [Pseudomonas aeruginosa]
MTHALFKQIDLTAKLGQDGSSLQAMNALRVIRETVAKHLAGTEGAGEIPLERALLALRTIAEFPCSEQDDLPAANMRQIALAALSGAGASSEPGNPGGEPLSGPGSAGERPYPAPGSGDSELAESLQTLVRWLDRVDIEDGYVGVPVIEAVEVAVNELRRLRQFERICEGLPQDAIDGGWTVQGIRGYAKRLEDQLKAAQAEVEALRAELQSQRERNTELIFKLGSATNGWGRCEKERDAAQARCAELKAELAMANDAAAKGDAARHQCAGMEMEIKELRGAADHWEAESRALQKLRDAALARVKALEALVAARIKDVPVDASVIALVGDFNEEQVHECKRFHDAIRAQCNPEAIVVFLSSTNDIQAVDEAAMCSAGWARTDAPVTQTQSGDHSELRRIAVALKNPLLSGDEASDLMVRYEALTMPDHIIALIDNQAQHSVPEGWMLVPVEQLLNMMSDKDHDTRIMAERQLLAVLAAAPGKEVGHE